MTLPTTGFAIKIDTSSLPQSAATYTRTIDQIKSASATGVQSVGKFDTSIHAIGESAEKHTPGMHKFAQGLQAMALGAAEAEGPIGRIAEGILLFGSGGQLGLATAGVIAFAAVFDSLTKNVREANDVLKEGVELFKQFDERQRLQKGLATSIDQLQQSRQRIASARALLPQAQTDASAGVEGATGAALALQKQINDELKKQETASQAIIGFESRGVQLDKESEDAAKRKADEEAARARARQQELDQIGKSEGEAAKLAAEASGNLAAAEALRSQNALTAIDQQVAATQYLTAQERDRATAAAQLQERYKTILAYEKEMAELKPNVVGNVAAANQTVYEIATGTRTGANSLPGTIGTTPAVTDATTAMNKLDKAIGVELASASRDGAEAAKHMREAEGELQAQRDKEARKVGETIDAVVRLGGQLGIFSQQTVDFGRGISQIAQGLIQHNPASVLSGALDALGTAFGAASAAVKQFQADLKAWVSAGVSPLDTQLQQLKDDLQKIVSEAVIANASTADFNAILAEYNRRVAEINATFAASQQAIIAEATARQLDAQGRADEAAAIRRQAAEQKEIADDLAAGYSAATIAAVKYAQQLEDEAAAKAKAAAAAATANAQAEAQVTAGFDIARRQATLAGDTTGAAQITLQGQADAARRQVNKDYAAGNLTEPQAEAEFKLITAELAKGLQDLADAATAAQAAIDARNKSDTDNLEVQRLVASGDDAAAHALQEQIDLENARTQGMSEANLATLRQVQVLQDQKQAADDAAAALRKAVDLQKAQSEANDSLQVRLLRAQGNNAAADLLAQQQSAASELADFQSKGYNAATIALLQTVSAAERARIVQDQASALASGRTANGLPSSSGSNALTSVTASQGDTMIGLQSTMVVYLRGIYQFVVRGSGFGVSASSTDSQLRQANLIAGQAIGVRPGL